MANGAGHGAGSGTVAILAAALLSTAAVLRRLRIDTFRPRSTWPCALEVPG
jgi:hypothetical protein